LKIKNKFLTDVLEAWCRVHYVPPDQLEDDLDRKMQIIWYNSDIRINNRPVFFKAWYTKNITYINDLLLESGKFHRYEHFREFLEINTHFLQYCGLITAIHWKFQSAIANVDDIHDIVNMSFVRTMCTSGQVFYSQLLEKTDFNCKWLNLFGIDRTLTSSIFKIIFTCTIDTKLQNFQYKLLHQILPTKSLLYKMHVKDNDLCNFCIDCSDSLVHIYYDCPFAREFWVEVQNLISTFVTPDDLNQIMRKENIILGYLSSDSWGDTINFILLFARHFLHCCYWTNKKPNFSNMFLKLKYYHSIELEIALEKNKLDKHIEKYKVLNNVW
jgi:hypothetical protein